jgi:glycosyltransferase involved in cell wall biosynthesis
LIPYVNSENFGFHLSLPNKTLDSISLGLPILSPLKGEVARLISNNGVGLRYGTDAGKTLIQCIQTLMDCPDLRQEMSNKALKLYQEEFSFDKVYGGLVKHLESLSLIKRKNGQR